MSSPAVTFARLQAETKRNPSASGSHNGSLPPERIEGEFPSAMFPRAGCRPPGSSLFGANERSNGFLGESGFAAVEMGRLAGCGSARPLGGVCPSCRAEDGEPA